MKTFRIKTNLYLSFIVIICFTFLLLIYSCDVKNSKELNVSKEYRNKIEKAKSLATKHFTDTLLHNKSYRIIKISELDSSFSNCLTIEQYTNSLWPFYDFLDSFDFHFENISKTNKIYKTDHQIHDDTIRLISYLQIIDSFGVKLNSISDTFKSQFNGWIQTYQLEVKNAFNVNTVMNATFHFDKSINTIVNYFDNYQLYKEYINFKPEDISTEIFKRHIKYKTLKI